jgi:hypothetical protein
MPKIRELTVPERTSLIKDRLEHQMTFRELGKKYLLTPAGAMKIVKKFQQDSMVVNRKRPGRKSKFTSRECNMIRKQVKKDGFVTRRELQSDFKSQFNKDISFRTISRELHKDGLKGRIAKQKPYISEKNRKARLNFANEHINKPIEFWHKIMWSDESKFELMGKRKKWVFRKDNDAFRLNNLQPTVKHSASVMVWGCFGRGKVGNLHFISGKMDRFVYKDILEKNLSESKKKIGLGRWWTFQQDNDPKHTSKFVKDYLNEKNIKTLQWPSQSPDLNPIEHLWDILDRKVPPAQRKNIPAFKEALLEAWDSIPTEEMLNLVESMPRRLKAVLQAKGGPTKY